MTTANYHIIAGFNKAIIDTTEDTFTSLPAAQRAPVPTIFLDRDERSSKRCGRAQEVSLKHQAETLDAESEMFDALAQFATHSLLIVEADAAEITRDPLIFVCPRWRDWLKNELSNLVMTKRLDDGAEQSCDCMSNKGHFSMASELSVLNRRKPLSSTSLPNHMTARVEHKMSSQPKRRPYVCRFVTSTVSLLMRAIAHLEIPDIKIDGNRPNGTLIIVNHRSLLDLAIGLVVFRQWNISPFMLSREGLFKIPIFSSLLRSLGGIPAGKRSGTTALRQSLRILQSGEVLVVAPEGRVSKPCERVDGLAELLPGVGRIASRSNTDVLIVGIKNADLAWPLGRPMPHFHARSYRRPNITVRTDWLVVDPHLSESETMTLIRSTLTRMLE